MSAPRRVLGGRYELGGKQGEGGMGQVYRARDLLKNRDVAVKLLAEELTADPVVRDRFRREADVLKELSHPALVALYDAELDGREPFLVFEFVEGDRLDQEIGGRPMPVARALNLLQQIASALAALHARHVVHRDVKPQNIIVRSDGTLCLLDFGTAKRFGAAERTAEQLTTDGFVIGTLQYMPPEALFKDAALAPTYDVWSCGVVLWEMLVGTRPFVDVESRGMTAFMDALRECHVPPLTGILPDVPTPVVHLVRALMERDPRQRVPDGAAVLELLEETQGALAISSAGDTRRLSRKLPRLATPRSLPMKPQTSGGTLVIQKPDARSGGRAVAMGGLIAILVATVAGAVWLNASGSGTPASAAPADAVAERLRTAVERMARAAHQKPFELVNALVEAAPAAAEAPDAGRAAFATVLSAHGVPSSDLQALESVQKFVREADGEGRVAPLIAGLLALEFIDQFGDAVEWPAGFRLGVAPALPPGYQQRVLPVQEGDLKKLGLPADGQRSGAGLRFTVSDPTRVTALWVALSGEALKRGHVVLARLNQHPFSMGGADPGHQPGAPKELRRALPAALLKAGENRLDARVIGAPAGSPHDPEGLKLALRVRTS